MLIFNFNPKVMPALFLSEAYYTRNSTRKQDLKTMDDYFIFSRINLFIDEFETNQSKFNKSGQSFTVNELYNRVIKLWVLV